MPKKCCSSLKPQESLGFLVLKGPECVCDYISDIRPDVPPFKVLCQPGGERETTKTSKFCLAISEVCPAYSDGAHHFVPTMTPPLLIRDTAF